jgi:hypothetical protein
MAAPIPTAYLQAYSGSDAAATTILQTPLFSLQGAAVSSIIPMSGASIYLAKSTPVSSTTYDGSNYTQTPLSTENILHGPDYISNSTLLYNSIGYKLQFITIHANLWTVSTASSKAPIQVSMVFASSTNDIFHIAIPIQYDTKFSINTENPFLKWWLYTSPQGTKPSSFSVNDLLLFNGTESFGAFDFYKYSLMFNSANPSKINSYNFCNFTTPLYINNLKLHPWFQNDLYFQNVNADGFDTTGGIPPPHRLKNFNRIFSFIFKGTAFAPTSDPWLISNRNLFIVTSTPTGIKPSKYSVKVSSLAYKTPTVQTERHLQNVKCYPIDLASQIDSDGTVYIDETTKKPLDISSLKTPPVVNPADLSTQASQAEFQNNILYWVIFSICIALSLVVIIALVVWLYSTKNTADPIEVEPVAPAHIDPVLKAVTIPTAPPAGSAGVSQPVPTAPLLGGGSRGLRSRLQEGLKPFKFGNHL